MPYLRRVYRVHPDHEDALVADLWQAGTLGVETDAGAPFGSETAEQASPATVDSRAAAADAGRGDSAWVGQVAADKSGMDAAEEGRDKDAGAEGRDRVAGGGKGDQAPGWVRLTAYFALPVAGLPQPISPLVASGAAVCELEAVLQDTDWMAEYRRRSQPFLLGRSLVVDPGEPEEGAAAAPAAPLGEAGDGGASGRRLLRLPARTAFGTGSHESTSLAIDLLEAEDLAGRTVLDVGTGTGILAFAALAWGAAGAVAFDVDPVAVFQARLNSRLNSLFPLLFTGRAAALRAALQGRRFDVAVVNVVPEQALPDLADMVPAVASSGALILSGLLAERAPDVLAHCAALGLGETARRQAGDWVALRLARGDQARPSPHHQQQEVRGQAPPGGAPASR